MNGDDRHNNNDTDDAISATVYGCSQDAWRAYEVSLTSYEWDISWYACYGYVFKSYTMMNMLDRVKLKEAVEAAVIRLNSHMRSGFYNIDNNPPESLFLNFLKKAMRPKPPEQHWGRNPLYYLSTKYIEVLVGHNGVLNIECAEGIPYTLEREIVLQLKEVVMDIDFYMLGRIENVPQDEFERKFNDIINNIRDFPVK